MTVVLEPQQVMAAARIMREAGRHPIKDKSYRQYGVGEEAGRFLRSLRWDGASPNTLDSYEAVLAKLALDHADFTGAAEFCSPVGTEYLREFLDRHWGESAPATKQQRTAVIRSFFQWATVDGRCPYNPAAQIRGPRAKHPDRQAQSPETIAQLIGRQELVSDEIALWLGGRLAFRKNEIRLCQLGDFDLARNMVNVHGKGGKERLIPLVYRQLRDLVYLHVQTRDPAEFLLFPRSDRLRPMDPATIHRWFKRCLERAGLPGRIKLHELRHSAGDELWRVTGNLVLAQKLLRHESVGTTQLYLHPTHEDLMAGMRQVENSWDTL